MTSRGCAWRQLPERPEEVFFDHLAHFVPDISAAGEELERAGFTLTPFTPQSTQHGPAGTGNRCIMLREGYLEILTPTGEDTPLAAQMNAAISRYMGTHLFAFAVTDIEAKADALAGQSFALQEPVKLRRVVDLDNGADAELRFAVLRLQPGQMPEGRIQYLTHFTPDALWQERYLTHANGAATLQSALVVVEDVAEASGRFERFFGLAPTESDGSMVRFALARGSVVLADQRSAAGLTGNAPTPDIPVMSAYWLGCADPSATAELWAERGFRVHRGPGAAPAIDCAGTRILAMPV
ncbi:MAG: VOC family protein [Pseudomonadota bacterium]